MSHAASSACPPCLLYYSETPPPLLAKQVQRMVLSSFLGRCWKPAQLAAVPAAFVLHSLLPAAGQAHLWRGDDAEELQHAVAAWVGRYAAAQPAQERRQLLLALLGLLADGGSSSSAGGSLPFIQQRPQVQTIMGALEAAAAAQTAGAPAGSPDAGWQWQMVLLGRLQDATRQLSVSWGAGGPTGSYAVSVCSSLLHVAATTGPLLPNSAGSSSTALAAAAAWLQQLPLPLLLPGGPLHSAAVDWLGRAGRQQLQPALRVCAEQYMAQAAGSGSSSSSSSGAGEAADQETGKSQASWRQHADGLARLAVLLTCSSAQAGPVLTELDLEAAFSSWDATLSSLYRR